MPRPRSPSPPRHLPRLPDLLSAIGFRRRHSARWRSARRARVPTSGRRCRRRPSTAADAVRLKADKSWVTSAGYADVYVVSAGSTSGVAGEVDLYAVPAVNRRSAGRRAFRRTGPARQRIRTDDDRRTTIPARRGWVKQAGGFDMMMQTVLPWFNLGNAAVSVGLAASAATRPPSHTSAAPGWSISATVAGRTCRRSARRSPAWASLCRGAARVLDVAADSVSAPDDDTMTHVLGVKASANDAALAITESAMRVCGGAAFSKHLPIERAFRDARAGCGDGADRRRALRLLRQSRHRAATFLGLGRMMSEPLIVGAVAYTPNVVPIWEGIRDYFTSAIEPDAADGFRAVLQLRPTGRRR